MGLPLLAFCLCGGGGVTFWMVNGRLAVGVFLFIRASRAIAQFWRQATLGFSLAPDLTTSGALTGVVE